ncbi:MAG: type III pantothenate kinase [Spirochaetes bacterium]|nr:type III pantothenate kinase [Spirochaetota bacterium]
MRTLVIDIGNSNITCGIFSGFDELQFRFRLHTHIHKTEDEYCALFRSILAEQGFPPTIRDPLFDEAILSSVVPPLTDVLSNVCYRFTRKPPALLGPSLYPFLPIKVLSPDEIGSDLVANALEAFIRCQHSCIVVDFGTALSFTAVQGLKTYRWNRSKAPKGTEDKAGEIAGVAIAPGIGSAVKALSRDTAQLFEVELNIPSTVLGKNTVHAIQSGVLHGYIGLVEHLIHRMKAELQGPVRVYASGGYSRLFKHVQGLFDEIVPHLTLYGIYHSSTFAPVQG